MTEGQSNSPSYHDQVVSQSSQVASKNSQAASSFSRGYLRYVVGLLFVVNIVNYMDRSIINILMEPIRTELKLTDGQMGLLSGMVFALFYAVAGLFLANLSDRKSRRWIISISIAVWGVATALTGLVQNFWHMLFARFSVGVGEASVIPTSNSLLSDYFKPAQRALVLGIFSCGAMIGVMGGSILGGYIAEHYHWRWAFVVAAIPAFPLAIIFFMTLREPVRGASDNVSDSASGNVSGNTPGNVEADKPIYLVEAIKILLAQRIFVFLVLAYSFYMFTAIGSTAWLPTFLLRQFEQPLSTVGIYFGIASGVGTAVGSISGGILTTRLARHDLQWLIRVPLMLIIPLWIIFEVCVFAPNFEFSVICIFLFGLVGGAGVGPLTAAIQSVVPPNLRSTAAGVNGFVASLIAVGGAPVIIGLLSDVLQTSVGHIEALKFSLAIASTVSLIGFAILWRVNRIFVIGLPMTKAASYS
jgi:MFS family permease